MYHSIDMNESVVSSTSYLLGDTSSSELQQRYLKEKKQHELETDEFEMIERDLDNIAITPLLSSVDGGFPVTRPPPQHQQQASRDTATTTTSPSHDTQTHTTMRSSGRYRTDSSDRERPLPSSRPYEEDSDQEGKEASGRWGRGEIHRPSNSRHNLSGDLSNDERVSTGAASRPVYSLEDDLRDYSSRDEVPPAPATIMTLKRQGLEILHRKIRGGEAAVSREGGRGGLRASGESATSAWSDVSGRGRERGRGGLDLKGGEDGCDSVVGGDRDRFGEDFSLKGAREHDHDYGEEDTRDDSGGEGVYDTYGKDSYDAHDDYSGKGYDDRPGDGKVSDSYSENRHAAGRNGIAAGRKRADSGGEDRCGDKSDSDDYLDDYNDDSFDDDNGVDDETREGELMSTTALLAVQAIGSPLGLDRQDTELAYGERTSGAESQDDEVDDSRTWERGRGSHAHTDGSAAHRQESTVISTSRTQQQQVSTSQRYHYSRNSQHAVGAIGGDSEEAGDPWALHRTGDGRAVGRRKQADKTPAVRPLSAGDVP